MRCPTVEKLLPLYVGGDLTSREAQAVDEHLASCPDCRKALAGHEAAHDALGRVAWEEPPAGDWRECWDAIKGQLPEAPSARISTFPVARTALRHLRVAAAVLLALGVGVLLGLGFRSSTPAPKVAVQEAPLAPQPKAEQPERALAKDDQGPAEPLLTVEDILGPQTRPVSSRPYYVAPVRLPRSDRGYYMDNIQLVGGRRRRR